MIKQNMVFDFLTEILHTSLLNQYLFIATTEGDYVSSEQGTGGDLLLLSELNLSSICTNTWFLIQIEINCKSNYPKQIRRKTFPYTFRGGRKQVYCFPEEHLSGAKIGVRSKWIHP